MSEVSIIGIDLAKRVCQLHGACANGAVIFEPLQLGGGATGAWLSAVCEKKKKKKEFTELMNNFYRIRLSPA